MKKVCTILLLLFIAITANPQKSWAFVGYFYKTADGNVIKQKKDPATSLWKACLRTPPKDYKDGIVVILFTKEDATTTEDDCYDAWVNEVDSGVVIYIDGTYYAEDTEMRAQLDADGRIATTSSISGNQEIEDGKDGEEGNTEDYLLYGNFREDGYDRLFNTVPSFENVQDYDVRDHPLQYLPPKPICIKDFGEGGVDNGEFPWDPPKGLFYISFAIGEDPSCKVRGLIRDNSYQVMLKINIEGQIRYFNAMHTQSLIVDKRILTTINEFLNLGIRKKISLIYVSKNNEFHLPAIVDNPRPILGKVSVGDGWVAILYYGPYGILEDKGFDFSLFIHDGKADKYKLTDKVDNWTFLSNLNGKIYPIEDVCTIFTIEDPRPMNPADNENFLGSLGDDDPPRLQLCILNNSIFVPDIIYGFKKTDYSYIYYPVLVK